MKGKQRSYSYTVLPRKPLESGPEAKKVTTLISYQDKGCDVARPGGFEPSTF